ncbi:hypothetical protein [Mycobacterium marseillense]|uniref:hypothetical protein n=1 Tax=Mycobacterium marseillense TaxID=701042 RepID=UPI001F4FDCC1|nr:hypothetical protein [Mycobacterium marseillense]
MAFAIASTVWPHATGRCRSDCAVRPTTKEQEFDSFLNYEVTIARWRFELMRLGAWFIGFQVTFFVFLVLPLVVMQGATGSGSPLHPVTRRATRTPNSTSTRA